MSIISCAAALPTKSYLLACLVASLAVNTSFAANLVPALCVELARCIRSVSHATTGLAHSESVAKLAKALGGEEAVAVPLAELVEADKHMAPARPLATHRTLSLLMRFVASLAALRVIHVKAYFALCSRLFTAAGLDAVTRDAAVAPAWSWLPFAPSVATAPPSAASVAESSLPADSAAVVTPLADAVVAAVLTSLPFLVSDVVPHVSALYSRAHTHVVDAAATGDADFDVPIEEATTPHLALEAELAGCSQEALVAEHEAAVRALLLSVETYLCKREEALKADALADAPGNAYCGGYGSLQVGPHRDELNYAFWAITGGHAADGRLAAGADGVVAKPMSILAPSIKVRRQLQLEMLKGHIQPFAPEFDAPTLPRTIYALAAPGAAPEAPRAAVVFVAPPLQTPPLLPPPTRPPPAAPVDVWLCSDYAITMLSTMDALREQQLLALLTLPPLVPVFGSTQAGMLRESLERALEDGLSDADARWAKMCPSLTATRNTVTAPTPHSLQVVVDAVCRVMMTPPPLAPTHPRRHKLAMFQSDVSVPPVAAAAKLVIDLVRLLKNTVMPVLAPRFDVIFRNLGLYRPALHPQFARVLSVYLVQVAYGWMWPRWLWVMNEDGVEVPAAGEAAVVPYSPQRAFLTDLFARIAQMSSVDVLLLLPHLPAEFHVLLPPRPALQSSCGPSATPPTSRPRYSPPPPPSSLPPSAQPPSTCCRPSAAPPPPPRTPRSSLSPTTSTSTPPRSSTPSPPPRAPPRSTPSSRRSGAPSSAARAPTPTSTPS
jgi:hypothetical protein